MSIKKSDGRDDLDDARDDDRDHGRVIVGADGNDILTGTSGADTIQGRDGEDTVDGLGGTDNIHGGKVNDQILGGEGDDRLNGGQGDDILTGGAGDDYIDGGPHGHDTAIYSGNYLDYDISFGAGPVDSEGYKITVVDTRTGSPDGTDTLRRVDVIIFADGELRDGQFYPSGPNALVTATALSADTGVSNSDWITFQAAQTVTGTFSGALRVGDRIQVSADSGTTWIDANISGSAWTANGVTLVPGSGSVLTRTIGAANDTLVGVSHAYVLDTTAAAPTLNISAGFTDSGVSGTDKITNSNSAPLTGTAEQGAAVQVYDGASLLATVTADATGAWSYNATGLGNGTHNFTAAQIDLAGNLSGSSAVSAITVDTSAAAPSLSAAFADTGASGTDKITNATNAALSGVAEKSALVQVYDGASLLATVTANAITGAWSYSGATLLSDGAHSFTAKQSDLAGNFSGTSAARAMAVDTSAAAPSLDAAFADTGASGTDRITSATGAALSGVAEKGAAVQVYDGASLLAAITADATTGAWSYAANGLSDGAHRFTAAQTDLAGNMSGNSAARAMAVDTSAAAPSLDAVFADTGASGTDKITSATSAALSGVAEKGAVVQVYDGASLLAAITADATTGAWSYAANGLSDGAHRFTAAQTDLAGNLSGSSAVSAITVDTSAAAPSIDVVFADTGASSTDKITSATGAALSGIAEKGAAVQVYDGASLLAAVTADATTGAWDYSANSLTDGAHRFTAAQIDLAGNMSGNSAARAMTVDTSAAAPGLDAVFANTGASGTDKITSATGAALSGVAETGALVQVYDGASLLATVTADAITGAWGYSANSLSDGAHSFTAAQTDLAGNLSGASAAREMTVDTSAAAPGLDAVFADSGASGTDKITSATGAALSGFAEKGAAVQVYDGASLLAAVTADATTGAWGYAANSLSDGPHSFTAAQIDLAGNLSGSSAARAMTVDSIIAMPVITAVNDNVGPIQGEIVNGANTDDRLPTFTGTAEAGSTVTVYDGLAILGTAIASNAGVWTFTPAATLAAALHSFTAMATDVAGNTGGSNAYPVTVSETLDNAPPVPTGTAATLAGTEDTPIVITAASLLQGFSDPDNDPLYVTGLSATQGSVTDNGNGTFTFAPAGDFDGEVMLTYTVTDARGGNTPAALVFDLDDVNDPAVITGTVAASLTETNAVLSATGSLYATDVDGAAAFTVQTNVAGSNGYGRFSVDGSGNWSYTTNAAHDQFVAGTNYTDSFTVTTNDGTQQLVTVTIAGTNDAAVITGAATGTVVEAGGVDNANVGIPTATGTLTASDVDGPAAFTAVAAPAGHGGYTVDAGGVWTYTLANTDLAVQGLGATQSLTDSFTVTTADGTQQLVTVTIAGTNDAALIAGAATGTVVEAGGVDNASVGIPTATGTLIASDVDGPATFTAVTAAAGHGGYTVDAGGVWTYTLANTDLAVQGLGATQSLTDSFTVTTADVTQQLVTVTIAGANDTPALTASMTTADYLDTVAADTFTAVHGSLSAVDMDEGATRVYAVNGGTGSVALAGFDTSKTGSYGTLFLNSTSGDYSYAPDSTAINALPAGTNPTDSFMLTVDDGVGGTASQTLTINLTGANDASVISGLSGSPDYSVGQLDPVAIAPDITLGDVDGDQVTSATVAIIAGFWQANDVLGFTPRPGIGGGYDPLTGVLTLEGSATLATYAAVLQSVNFSTNTAGGRTFSFTVTDNGVSATVDTSSKSLDNLGTTGFRLPGEAERDFSGFTVSSAGDVNGDGYADVIIGAPWADPSGAESGLSYVVFGQSTNFGGELLLSDVDAASGNGFRVIGASASDATGISVSAAGDVNGDGFGDLIIGALDALDAGPNAVDRSGAAYVVFGKPAGLAANVELANLDTLDGFRISGIAHYDRAGYSVSAAGDVDGDGFSDLIIGAVNASPNGVDRSGAAYVVFGKAEPFAANLDLSTLDGTAGFRLDGIFDDDRTGDAVSTAGDVNGDGYSDLIIGATRASPDGVDMSGEVYVVFGKGTGFTANMDLAALDGSDGFRMFGAGEGAQAGYAVSTAGDVNGDGFGDLIIGAPYASTDNGLQTGAAYVVFGKADAFAAAVDLSALDGSDGFRIEGVSPEDWAGYSVSAAGDVNGDGYGDLIIGAPHVKSDGQSSGESYVLFGKSSGFAADINLAALDPNDGFRVSAVGKGDASGYAVSSAGDVNGDGFDDVIVGAAYASPSGLYSGESYIIYGSKFIVGTTTFLGSGTGGTVAETFIGSKGNDTMTGGGGTDAFSSGAGDDTLRLGAAGSSDSSFLNIDGGSGFDTLVLDGSGMTLDLNTPGVGSRVQEIEEIDLTGSGNNTLNLNIRDVLNISDTSNRLFVEGDAGDSVTSMGQGWALSPGGPVVDHGHTFDSYTLHGDAYSQGMANLLIEQQVTFLFS